jgi:hypothetical protein
MKNTKFHLILTTLLVTLSFGELKAQDGSDATIVNVDQIMQYLNTVSSLNHGIALDGGGSLGAEGTRFGLGLRRIKYDNKDSGLSNSNLYANQKGGSDFQVPFVMISKGVMDGLNVGFNFGSYSQHRVSMMQFHAQYTLFEKFRLPSIAWRVQHVTTFGLQSTEYQAWQTGPVLSYSPFSFVTLNLRGGWAFHTAKVANDLLRQNVVYLVNAAEQESYTNSWKTNYFAAGLNFLVFPPFGNAGLELIRQQGSADSYLLHLSLNI